MQRRSRGRSLKRTIAVSTDRREELAMSRNIRLSRLLLAGALTLALAIPLVRPQPAHAVGLRLPLSHTLAPATRPPALPATLAAQAVPAGVAASLPVTMQVPVGNVAYLAARGNGVQMYTC